jgi:hypothetical protein
MGQIIGKMPTLIARVLELDSSKEEKITEILKEIEGIAWGSDIIQEFRVSMEERDQKTIESSNLVVKFFKINNLLLQPWVIVPQSTKSNSFITLTETALLRMLGMNDWLKSQKRSMIEPQGSFLKVIFGERLGGRFDDRVGQ